MFILNSFNKYKISWFKYFSSPPKLTEVQLYSTMPGALSILTAAVASEFIKGLLPADQVFGGISESSVTIEEFLPLIKIDDGQVPEVLPPINRNAPVANPLSYRETDIMAEDISEILEDEISENEADLAEFEPGKFLTFTRAANIVSNNLNRQLTNIPKDLVYLDSRLLDEVYTSNRALMELITEIKEDGYHKEEEMSEPVSVLLNFYFTTKDGFTVSPERTALGISKGKSDYLVQFRGPDGQKHFHTFVECKKLKGGDSFGVSIVQLALYNLEAGIRSNQNHSFGILVKGTYIMFYEFNANWHVDNGFNCKRAGYNGLLSLYCDKYGVKVVEQLNLFGIQTVIYDLSNEYHAFSIHSIFKYLVMHRRPPVRDSLLKADLKGYARGNNIPNNTNYMQVVYNC